MSIHIWQKSSHSSEGNNCIELAADAVPATIHLRESDTPATVLTVPSDRMAVLLAAARTGRIGLHE